MKISLIVRTLNEEGNINHCLTCISRQTLVPDEVLVVDNESTDRTIEIVRGFSNILNIKIISNPIKGYASGLNLGYSHASHEIIGFLSADCFPEPDWLKHMALALIKYDCAVVQGTEIHHFEKEYREIDDINFVIRETRPEIKRDGKITFFNNTNIVYRRAALEKHIPFKGIGKENGAEDTIMSIRFKKSNYIAIQSCSARVIHTAYESSDDFKKRTISQGRRLCKFLYLFPLHPRTYLNPFYWSLIEFAYFFKTGNTKFIKTSFLRIFYILKGIIESSLLVS